jgi:Cu+-exporting ATPase
MEEKHLAKEEAKAVLDYMRDKMGLKVAMCTGDNKYTALRVAKYLEMPEESVTYRAYPNDKKKLVKKLQEQGEKVMFVGDGVNDSPVLAQADVGVAINSVADITVQAAGIVVMKDRLDDVLNAILISKATFRRIKYNFGWAFVYNVILIPVAMGVFFPIKRKHENGMELGFQLDPIYAGLAMALSSFSVVLSSLWLKTFKYHQVIDKKAFEEALEP